MTGFEFNEYNQEVSVVIWIHRSFQNAPCQAQCKKWISALSALVHKSHIILPFFYFKLVMSEPDTFLERFKVVLNKRCFSFSSVMLSFIDRLDFMCLSGPPTKHYVPECCPKGPWDVLFLRLLGLSCFYLTVEVEMESGKREVERASHLLRRNIVFL